jgi:hypothetical protein
MPNPPVCTAEKNSPAISTPTGDEFDNSAAINPTHAQLISCDRAIDYDGCDDNGNERDEHASMQLRAVDEQREL